MATMTSNQAFSQGARCGHIEGKGRAGQYVIDEEFEASEVATKAQGLPTSALDSMWAAGYRHGYLRAAEGSELEPELQGDYDGPIWYCKECGNLQHGRDCDELTCNRCGSCDWSPRSG